jgi:hypothetical protein
VPSCIFARMYCCLLIRKFTPNVGISFPSIALLAAWRDVEGKSPEMCASEFDVNPLVPVDARVPSRPRFPCTVRTPSYPH